jgi:mRNA-degrading endonuclease RelE of RelBE toxin-antitoxin system
MQVAYSTEAQKQLKKLPKTEAIKVLRKIEVLKSDPGLGKKLKGRFEGLRSFRAWPYRIFYFYSPSEGLYIDVIEHRQGAYK